MIESVSAKVNTDVLSLEMAITEMLRFFGIPAHIKGYRYIREAVIMAVNDPNTVDLITKHIYPDIAKKHGTTPSKVERAMRHALEIAWKRGLNSPLTDRIFPSNDSKPKNNEFISALANWVIVNRSE
jgi:two-component system response regulator (stage 0 sporulation protein A)